MEKRALQRCKPSFLSARYNACNPFPALVRPDVVKPPAYSGVMSMRKFLLACFAAVLVLAGATQAFAERNFPEQAKRGDMKAYEYPSMKIGDNVYRLTAGSRIFNQQNLIIMPASLQIQTAPVMYMLDISGDLSRIWLLTGDEATRLPVPK
jgi:hypothetical protein